MNIFAICIMIFVYWISVIIKLIVAMPMLCKAIINNGLTKREQYYNDTILKLCNKFSNSQYLYYEYSIAKDYITKYLKTQNFTDKEIQRALSEIEDQEKRNGPEYPFYVRGRSSCFLLQSFLAATTYQYLTPREIFKKCMRFDWH